jgi:hypothetical protein
MRPCRVKEAWRADLALANSEGLEQRHKQSRSMLRLWSSTTQSRAGLSRDYRASAANRERSPKSKPFIYKPCKFVLVRQSPRREA